MNDKFKLVDIVVDALPENSPWQGNIKELVDYLISHGVTLQKHGRWVWDAENECWLCSACEQSALNNYRGNSADSNYCPLCGARMDKEGTMCSFGERHKQISKREHYFEEASNKGIAQLLWEIEYDAYASAVKRSKMYFPYTTDGWMEWLQEAYDEPYKPHFERWREDNED